MIARFLRILWAFVVCATFLAQTTVGWAQPEKNISPEQAKAMIVSFLSSPEGARLGLRNIGGGPFRPASTYTPFADPQNGLIRLQGWRVDPVKRTVILPRANAQIQGPFAKDGDRYVIKDAGEVEVSWIKPEEAKAMILHFLSTAQAATLPDLPGLRKIVESASPSSGGRRNIGLGPWSVDPLTRDVRIIVSGSRELYGVFVKEGETYSIFFVSEIEIRRKRE